MRILYYNWTQFDKKNNDGGGVNVYQKNLVKYLVDNTNNEIYFLSSGIYYDILKKKAYIKQTKNIFGDKCKSFKIINSTCTAPSKAMYDDIENYLNDDITYELLKEFIKKYGEFDVIHFNNIEGLSGKCLEIKKDFPNTKVIYSIHNYFLFCPQINLFFNNECNCIEYDNGKKCCTCLSSNINKKTFIKFYKIDGLCEKCHLENFSKKIKLFAKKVRKKLVYKKNKVNNESCDNLKCTSEDYRKYREINVERINKYVDVVLAVSERVRQISVKTGIRKDKVYTNYIGTAFAEHSINHLNTDVNKSFFTIAYMGYFDKIKGFDFFIEALEEMPDELAKKIKFVCYAKMKDSSDEEKSERVKKLNEKFYSAEYYNGYNHKELANILSNINLGIIPVVWEDNLPQIAIEYVAHGVPVLASDLGGAHELSKSKDFIFRANDKIDFTQKLKQIIENKELLNDYFEKSIKLTTMEEHMNKLFMYYKQ